MNTHFLPPVLLTVAAIFIVAQVSCNAVSVAPADPIADNLSITFATGPLPAEAYRARLFFAYDIPERVRTDERASIHVLVKNESQLAWPCNGQPDGKYQIRVGNRWLDQSGNAVDDARGTLAYDLLPGDTAEVQIIVKAPATRGTYILEFDLVQEQVTWFSEKGSEPLRVKVSVE